MSNISEKSINIINLYIPGLEGYNHDFDSKYSLLDKDITIFYPKTPNYTEYITETYQGKYSYDENESFRYKEQINHWKEEIKTTLKSKKNVFVILSDKKEFYLKTGQKDIQYKYKTQHTTSYVNLHNNFEFLPISIDIFHTYGDKVNFSNEYNFYEFYQSFKEDLFYSSYIKDSSEKIKPFITTPDKNRIVGGYFQKENEGCLVFLPDIDFNREDFEKVDGTYNKKAIKYGEKYIQEIINIDTKLSSTIGKSSLPSWAKLDNFKTKTEKKIELDIAKFESQIYKIQEKIKNNQVLLQNQFWVKDLLFETGKPLEEACKKAMELLEYTAQNYNDGTLELDLEIISPEKRRYIGECEGRDTKDINITKYRQLVESINRDFDRDEINEKAFGILFGNPQRLSEPNKRTSDFTEKCKIGAKSDKIALIKTADLFNIVKYLLENDDKNFKKQCREAIHNSLGEIVVFPQPHPKS